jgi:hypothetical protein
MLKTSIHNEPHLPHTRLVVQWGYATWVGGLV